jgi:hypothetical protein
MAAAQRARWAGRKGVKIAAEQPLEKKRTISEAHRKALALAAKKRWAKAKRAGKSSL